MTRKTRSYRDSLLEDLSDPTEAALYLNAALDDSLEMFLVALKDVAQARQMSDVAKEAGIQRETLYRCLSERGNPTLDTLTGVLAALRLRLSIIGIHEDISPTNLLMPPAQPSLAVESYMIAFQGGLNSFIEAESFGILGVGIPKQQSTPIPYTIGKHHAQGS